MDTGIRTPWRPILTWIAFNLLGWMAAPALALALRSPGSTFDNPAMLIVVIAPPALAQWLVLRRLVGMTPLWLITIPLGFLIFIGLVVMTSTGVLQLPDDEGTATLSALYAILGGLVGVFQWLILRRYFRTAGIWVAASAAGTGIGLAIVLITKLMSASGIAAIAVFVLTYAAFTGAALEWLLARGALREAVRAA
jgi:hypothetical protein